MDTRTLKMAENNLELFLEVHWKYMLHAFHRATHLDYQHFVCVCLSMPSDQLVTDGGGLKFAILLLDCRSTYICGA